MNISKSCRTALLVTFLTSAVSIPLANANPGERGGRRGPPQEAFDACVSKAEGDVCTFSGHRGDVEGTCMSPPQGEGALACAPDRGPDEREPRDSQDTQ